MACFYLVAAHLVKVTRIPILTSGLLHIAVAGKIFCKWGLSKVWRANLRKFYCGLGTIGWGTVNVTWSGEESEVQVTCEDSYDMKQRDSLF